MFEIYDEGDSGRLVAVVFSPWILAAILHLTRPEHYTWYPRGVSHLEDSLAQMLCAASKGA